MHKLGIKRPEYHTDRNAIANAKTLWITFPVRASQPHEFSGYVFVILATVTFPGYSFLNQGC